MSTATPTGPGGPGPYVPNYLVQSILVTIFCCLPTGIAAIVFASQVNAKLAAGDISGAQASSANAKKWIMISLIAGIIVIGLTILMQCVFVGAAISNMEQIEGQMIEQMNTVPSPTPVAE